MAIKYADLFFGIAGATPFVLLLACVQNNVWWQEYRMDFGRAFSLNSSLIEGESIWIWKKNPFRYERNMDFLYNGTDIGDYYSAEGDNIGSKKDDFCSENMKTNFGDECCGHFEPIQNLMISSIVTGFCAWMALLFFMFLSLKNFAFVIKWICVLLYITSGTLVIIAVVQWNQDFDDAVCGENELMFGNLFQEYSTKHYLDGYNLACTGAGFAFVLSIFVIVLSKYNIIGQVNALVSHFKQAPQGNLIF